MTPSIHPDEESSMREAFLIEWNIKATIVQFADDAFADCYGEEHETAEDLYREDEVDYCGTSSFAYASVERANTAAESMFQNFKETFLHGFKIKCISDVSVEDCDEKENDDCHVVKMSRDETNGSKSWKWHFLEKDGAYENTFLHRGSVSLKRIQVVE